MAQAQAKKLKRQHLGIVIAEPSDLPVGSLGEFITADTLKPYLDQIAQKATPAQITTAVNALEAKILGGAGLDADTLAELNAKISTLQNLTEADKTGILNLLAQKVSTTDIMPIVNAKADEASVQTRLDAKADETSVAGRLATKANEASVQTRLDTKADEASVQTRLDAKADEASVQTRLNTKSDEASVASRLATKATEASVATRLATKADETSVATRLADKADEASVASRLATKATEASVATRLADKADETSVATRLADKADEASVVTRLATKTTAQQVETIAQGIANALESKILGGVGTDTDTIAELKSYVDNLQSLSEADVNGVMQLVAQKVAKSDIYSQVANPKGEDLTETGALISNFISDFNITPDKVVSANLLNLLIQDLLNQDTHKWEAQAEVNTDNSNAIDSKLDKTVFDDFAQFTRSGKRSVTNLALLGTDYLSISSLGDAGNDLNLQEVESDIENGLQMYKLLFGSKNGGSVAGVPFANLLNFLLESPQSVISQRFATKLSKAEFAQFFQLLAQEVSYSFANGTSINAQVTTQKKIAFDNDIAIKKLVVGDMQIDSLTGSSTNENGIPANVNELTAAQIGTDLPDEGGDGFLHFVLVDAEEGFVKRVKPMQLMNLIAFDANSPIKQSFDDRDATIQQLTARIQALEDMFENA